MSSPAKATSCWLSSVPALQITKMRSAIISTVLAKVNDKVSDRLILIPRIYTNKPRTTGDGYKGIVHQPDPEKKEDFLHGLIAMRHMHIRALSETGLSAADEMLYPENWGYVSDILSYVAIGARSVEDQQHRLTVSGFDLPSGMKNPTSGDFSVMLNSVYAAQHPHRFIYRGYEVQTNGNDLAHTVLRGATSKHGRNIPNYHYEDLQILLGLYNERDLKNPACIIDSNHSNSNKQFDQQVRIVKEVMHSRHLSPDIQQLRQGRYDRELYRRRQPEGWRRRLWKVHHRRLPRLGSFRASHLRSGGAELLNITCLQNSGLQAHQIFCPQKQKYTVV